MSAELLLLLLIVSLLVGLATGLPIAFVLGSIGVIFMYSLWGAGGLYAIGSITLGKMLNYYLAAIPLFIFMAMVLQSSGVAEDLFKMMHRWLGGLRGGLGMGTVVICTLMAAMCGISGVGTLTMGIIALPQMLKRKYDRNLALGLIPAGGTLGSLIPPSIAMIIYGLTAEVSVGKLFFGGILPGLVMSSLFILYIGVRCFLRPEMGPPLPPEERGNWREKLVSLRGVILPILLVLAVMGSIFAGVTTISEAAAVGAIGSILCAAIYRRLNWGMIKAACYETLRINTFVFFLIAGATIFSSVLIGFGGQAVVADLLQAIPFGRWGVLIVIQIILLGMGCFLDPASMILIGVPVFVPVITSLGFDPLWFGLVYIINTEIGYLTPPFGMTLFIFKGVTPPDVTMGDIYRSAIPFVLCDVLTLIIVMIFPTLVLLIPSFMLG